MPTKIEPITNEDWLEYLGQFGRETDYLNYFLYQLNTYDQETVLKRHLPTLVEGIMGGGLHGVIQTWCAVQFGEKESIMLVPQTSLIQSRGENVASNRMFSKIVGQLKISREGFQEFRLHAAKIFAEIQNFSLLHVVTSSQAIQGLLIYFPDDEEALFYYFQAVLSLYVTMGMPVSKKEEYTERPDWKKLSELGIQSWDEHTIKMIFTCKLEFDATSEPVYATIAEIMAKKTYQYQRRFVSGS